MNRERELLRHEELIQFCEKRILRAQERLAGIMAETHEAKEAMSRAVARRDAFVEANPDPQMDMF